MSKCWYCNEEITTGNNPEHLGICDKCYNEMFKCGNEFIRNMINKIADLETKLAESFTEKDVESLIKDREDTIKFLKQQLTEKETEIEEFKNRERKIFSLSLYTEFENKLKQANQDKISFAVEQLEKVKWWCQGNAIQCFYNEAETEIKEKHIVVDRPQENGSPSLIKYIDNQIKQLREK